MAGINGFFVEAVIGYESHDNYVEVSRVNFYVVGGEFSEGFAGAEHQAHEKLRAMTHDIQYVDPKGISRSGWYRIDTLSRSELPQ